MRPLWRYYVKHQLAINLGLAIFGITFGLFVYFIPYTPKTRLTAYIQQESDVQINTSFDGLKILYKDLDIRQNHLNLKFYKIRIQNDGSADIQEGNYANQEPFGLAFKDALVLSAHLASSNDAYIKRNMHIEISDSTRIILKKLILENSKYYEFEVLTLYKDNAAPSLTVMGKIAGQDEIALSHEPYIREADAVKDRLNAWVLSFKEKLRGWQYIVPPIVALLVISGIQTRTKQRELIRMYKKRADKLSDERKFLSSLFTKLSKPQFQTLLEILPDPALLEKNFQEALGEEEITEQVRLLISQGKIRFTEKKNKIYYTAWFWFAINAFIKDGFASVHQNDTITLTPAMLEEIKTAQLLLSS